MFRTYTGSLLIFNKASISLAGYAPYSVFTFVYPFNPTYGINTGGRPTAGGITNKYERATYSTETNSTNTNTLSTSLFVYSQAFVSTIKTYTCGGDTDQAGANRSTVIRGYTYSTDTAASITNVLSSGRYLAGAGTSNGVGYVLGGNTSALGNTSEKLTFSSETVSSGPTLSTSTQNLRGAGNDSYLYVVGAASKVIDRIAIASNTLTTISGANINAVTQCTFRLNPAMTHCYALGGPSSATSAEKLSLATETSAAISAIATGTHGASSQGSTTKLYLIGGYAGGWTTQGQGYTVATDTSGNVSGMNAISTAMHAAGN